MTWLRKFELFDKVRRMDEFRAQKYQSFFRLAYFFCTGTLLLYALHVKHEIEERQRKDEESKRMEAGYPIIQDESEAHARLRKSGVEVGELYKYTPEKGWHLEEYHRGEYLSRLQSEAFKQAKDAQRKALAEGKVLPPDSILLVDELKTMDHGTSDRK